MSLVFDLKNKKKDTEKNQFLDESVSIARYDILKYKQYDLLTEKMLGFMWRPQEVDVTKDRNDFKKLSDNEKHIFTSNLKRQILLDSVQGRAPNLAFLPIASLPELETLISTWAFFETIHSKSYTHIIRNVYANPSEIFDDILSINEIVDCASDISKYYDTLIEYNVKSVYGGPTEYNLYDHKKALWMALHSVYILEGVRFYVSFACSWAFAELKQMEGNAKIIKFIARDENTHLAASTHIIKNLLKEDSDYTKIKDECSGEVSALFNSVIQQEKDWAHYLFKDGSMIGLNAQLLKDYVDFIAAKRAKVLGVTIDVPLIKTNPLPWTEKWISGGNVQVAPQETEISSYIVGGIKQDMDNNKLKGLSL